MAGHEIFDPELSELRSNELAFIGPGGVEVWAFGCAPSTDDIAVYKKRHQAKGWTHVIQKIGDEYEVYDLKTVRQMGHSNIWTIGLPVHTNKVFDAAVMVALLI